MGSTRIVPYTIEVVVDHGAWTPIEWHVRQPAWMRGRGGADGKPTTLNIRRWVGAHERSMLPGGANEHLGPARILAARIKDQRSGAYVADWRRDEDPAFANRAGLSASAKRSAMVSGMTLADYEAMARRQQQRGPTGTVVRQQTVAMTPGGAVVMNRAKMNRTGRDPSGWGFVARKESPSGMKYVYVSRAIAEQIAESPARSPSSPPSEYLALWLVPPFYMKAGEGKWRAEKGWLPMAWSWESGKQELPEDFLRDPQAWKERMKREDYPTCEKRDVAGTRAWSAKNRAHREGMTVVERMHAFNDLIDAYRRSWHDTHTRTANARHIVAAVKKYPSLMQQIPYDVFDLAVADAAANRAAPTDPSNLKSERSAKILMTRMERRYEAARDEKMAVMQRGREGGWNDELFAEQRKAEAKMSAIVDEMRALSDAAHKRGWYVKGSLLRYWDSPTAALVAANID